MKKIYLIGMPGSGKTTLGKQLAANLSLPFIDLDDEIIKQCDCSINDIFNQYGEPYFRTVEQDMLMQISRQHNGFVMATGGGAPCFFDNMKFMNETGTTVWLDISVEVLFNRLKEESAHRPLLKDKTEGALIAELSDKLNYRGDFYNKSRVTLSNDNITMEMILKALDKKG